MTHDEANAQIDALSDALWPRMDNEQQFAFYAAWQPRGQPEDPAAGLAYLQAVAASLPPNAPDLDAAIYSALPARVPRHASARWLCGCGAFKNPKSQTCRACYEAGRRGRAA